MLRLFDYFRSSACYRVRIALNLKELDYELVPVHLIKNGGEQHSHYYQAINPQALVPALEHKGQIITQSLAIIEYLEDLYPEPALIPTNPFSKAYVKAIALTIAADTHPLNNLRVLNYLTQTLQVNEEQKTAWYHHWLKTTFDALEKKIKSSELAGDFCYGDIPTLADVCLIPQLFNAHRFNFDLTPYTTLKRIENNCQHVEAFADAVPMETPA